MIYNIDFDFQDKDSNCIRYFVEIINESLLYKHILQLNPLTFETDNGDILPFDKLSHGERRHFTLWYIILIASSKNSFILIDDPERSLSLVLQRKFVSTLLNVHKELDFSQQYLISTHSPSIIDLNQKWIHIKHYSKQYWDYSDALNKIYIIFQDSNNKKDAFLNIVSIVENIEDDNLKEEDLITIREKSLRLIKIINPRENNIFSFLENLLILTS
jgi:predicted ATPase